MTQTISSTYRKTCYGVQDMAQQNIRAPARKLPSPRKAAAGVAKRTSPRKAAQRSQQAVAQKAGRSKPAPSEAACSTQAAVICNSPSVPSTSDRGAAQLSSPEPLTGLALGDRSAAGPASTSGSDLHALPAAAQQQAAMQAQRWAAAGRVLGTCVPSLSAVCPVHL